MLVMGAPSDYVAKRQTLETIVNLKEVGKLAGLTGDRIAENQS